MSRRFSLNLACLPHSRSARITVPDDGQFVTRRVAHTYERSGSLPLKDAIAVGVVQVFIINDVGMSSAPSRARAPSNSMPFAPCIVITWARPLAPDDCEVT